MGAGSAQTGRGLTAAIGGLLAFLFSFEAAACTADAVVFRTSAGDVSFSAEVADDEATRAQGLMWREEMAADHGMLFVYPTARPVTFWMKNTPLPLDIIFVNGRGVVCGIAKDTTPFSEDFIPSRCAAQTVFEVNAGEAEAQGVSVGAVMRHPAVRDPLWSCEE